ncbi:MAG TPA: hypothetical protein VI893_07300 [Thermoplasmata archaeon]|nr:hypothetical protein [Thermoplasmata archaeon]
MESSKMTLRLVYAVALLVLVVSGLSALLASSSTDALYTSVGALVASALIAFVLLVMGCGTGIRTLIIGGSVVAYSLAAALSALLSASTIFVPRGVGGIWGIPTIFVYAGAILVIGTAASDGASRELSDHVLYALLAGANAILAGPYAGFLWSSSGAAAAIGMAVTGCLIAATVLPLLGRILGGSAPATGPAPAPMQGGG